MKLFVRIASASAALSITGSGTGGNAGISDLNLRRMRV